MPETGKTYEADIIDTTLMGAGVARIDGAAVFVRGCAEGDRCTVLIKEKKKNFFLGEAVGFSSLSEKRCGVGCRYYGRCGGCSLRHVTYAYEGNVKERAVRAALEKAGVKGFKLNPIIMPSPERYRNKAVFHLDGRGGAAAGKLTKFGK